MSIKINIKIKLYGENSSEKLIYMILIFSFMKSLKIAAVFFTIPHFDELQKQQYFFSCSQEVLFGFLAYLSP
jgi:hypothetical protein